MFNTVQIFLKTGAKTASITIAICENNKRNKANVCTNRQYQVNQQQKLI